MLRAHDDTKQNSKDKQIEMARIVFIFVSNRNQYIFRGLFC